jgi:ABC-2 type transport system ATP-binding protein
MGTGLSYQFCVMTKTPPAISVEALSYGYGSRKVLSDVSFDLQPACCTILLGPNGAGKTTLFSLITRLLAVQQGRISTPNQSLADIGIVFQQSALDLDLTVQQNLTYYAGLHGLPHEVTKARIMETTALLGIYTRLTDKVRTLNGGHRRRVEIARALLTKPKVLLLDEPTSGLDIPSRDALVTLLHALASQQQIAILWATHLVDEVWPDDKLLILSGGHITAQGTSAEIMRKANVNSLGEAFAFFTREVAA